MAGGIRTRSSAAREKQSGADDSLYSNTGTAPQFSLVRSFHFANLLTIANACCGFLACAACLAHAQRHGAGEMAMSGELTREQWWAGCLMPLGGLFDVVDGKVARSRETDSLLGQELDSLADLISFGVAPALFALILGFQSTLDVVGLTFFVSCVVARLARYNATLATLPKDESGKVDYFEGTPAPTSLLLVALLVGMRTFLTADIYHRTVGAAWGYGGDLSIHGAVVMYMLCGTAMVSRRLHIPKF